MVPYISGKWEGGRIPFPKVLRLQGNSFAPWCLQALCERSGCVFTDEAEVCLTLYWDNSLPQEGYRLQIAPGIVTVTASGETGIIRALTTLYKLRGEDGTVPRGEVEDAPRMAWRGLHLDCVRHFFPTKEILTIIEELSLFQMNIFHWHLTNDQGFRIESKRFPKLHSQCGKEYYTQEDIRRVVTFAKTRGVEVVPEISMPGHVTAILAAYPSLSCSEKPVELAKSGGVYAVDLCPGKETVYDFIKELLEEICPLFPSPWFHTGGDEAPDWEWEKCEHCRGLMQREGFTKTRQLQGYFSGRVRQILQALGKNMICFNDSLTASNFRWQPEGETRTRIQYWSIQYANQTQRFLDAGGEMIYSDMFELYLDYPSAMSPMKKLYQCVPAIRGKAYPQAVGMEACLWSENFSDRATLHSRLFPRLYAFAENTWSGQRDYTDFLERLTPELDAARLRGILCQSLDEADPQGEARKHGIMAYTALMQTSMSPEMREQAVKFTQPNAEFQARFMEQFFGIPQAPQKEET